jgi:hypothetical protein
MTPEAILVFPGEAVRACQSYWGLRVVENKFPVLLPQGTVERKSKGRFHLQMDGYGRHEVIIESPKHNATIGILSDAEVEVIICACRFRFLVGVMVEVPFLAILAKKLMKEVDFVSIGTNDLVQFTLAVDRDNDLVSDLYQPLHPSILWLIRNVVDAGKANGKSVSICGEMAGNPIYFPLLFGLGLREFSVAPIAILEIKEMARRIIEEEACEIARKALDMDSPQEIAQLLLNTAKPRSEKEG